MNQMKAAQGLSEAETVPEILQTRQVVLTPNTCRWCLLRFDPERQKPRTTWERGQLRTRLKMSDDGSELVICDNCWPGGAGEAEFVHGQIVPTPDPTVVPVAVLRASLEDQK